MYIETIKKLHLTPKELTILSDCHELLEEIIHDSNQTDLDEISWEELCIISEKLLFIFDMVEKG